MKNIGIDLDQVVFDIMGEILDIYNEITGENLTKDKWTKYLFRDVVSYEKEREIFDIMYERGGLRDMRVIPHARESLEKLSENHKIIIVTSRHPNRVEDTFASLEENQIPYHDIVFKRYKEEVARAYNFEWFVEDNLNYALDISRVCACYLFDLPYNRTENTNGVKRVPGFEDETWWPNLLNMISEDEERNL